MYEIMIYLYSIIQGGVKFRIVDPGFSNGFLTGFAIR
jgi:hypothetical protein